MTVHEWVGLLGAMVTNGMAGVALGLALAHQGRLRMLERQVREIDREGLETLELLNEHVQRDGHELSPECMREKER